MNTRESCEEKLARSGLKELYLDRVNEVLEDSCTREAEEAFIRSIEDHFDDEGLLQGTSFVCKSCTNQLPKREYKIRLGKRKKTLKLPVSVRLFSDDGNKI
jgi:hypothetical protein